LQLAARFSRQPGTGQRRPARTKLVLGRRRPRDELEMNRYGFILFGFNLDWNSFPSGHRADVMCVAVIPRRCGRNWRSFGSRWLFGWD